MTHNLLLEVFPTLSLLPQPELRTEFQGTSHLGSPPNDVPSRHYRMMIELSKLRRKSWKCSTIDCNFINLKPDDRRLQAKHPAVLPPEQKDHSVSLRKTLLHLKDQLGQLSESLESDESLGNLYEIDTCLDELRPFTNTVRLCQKSKTCSHNPQAFTLYRCQFVLRGYAWLLNDLSRLFASFRSLYRSRTIQKAEVCWVLAVFGQIDERIRDCNRTNMDMVRHQWGVMIQQFDAMRTQAVVRLKSLEAQHDQSQDHVRSGCNGFILLTKLTRLLMNKIARFTNKEYLMRLNFDQVEQLNQRFETIRNCFYRLLTSVDHNNERPIANFRPLDRVAKCFEETCDELTLHFSSLDPNSEEDFTVEMLGWCEMFRKSYNIAVGTFIPRYH